jgi:hypothetical protein
MAAMGLTMRTIARHFRTSETTASAIVLGKTWKTVGGPIRQRKEKE